MRKFEQIKKELNLKKFLHSELGTLYFIPAKQDAARIMVRYFDKTLPPSDINTFVEIIRSVKGWISQYKELSDIVEVVQPIEIGIDFIARPHHTYYVSLRSYDDKEDGIDPPKEFEQLKASFNTFFLSLSEILFISVKFSAIVFPFSKKVFVNKSNSWYEL